MAHSWKFFWLANCHHRCTYPNRPELSLCSKVSIVSIWAFIWPSILHGLPLFIRVGKALPWRALKSLKSFIFNPLLSSCRTDDASRKYYCFAYIPIFTTEVYTLISHRLYEGSSWWYFLDLNSRRPPLIQTWLNKNFKIIKEPPRGQSNWDIGIRFYNERLFFRKIQVKTYLHSERFRMKFYRKSVTLRGF